ncbi:MAG TPA: CoA-binding protein [Thermoplasmata archaeon]|nr:CoA-binding protein [Thermoplasmata archaeon]
MKRAAGVPCPMPPTDEELRTVLTRARTIAIVGLSDKADRDSNEVARYLRAQGYRIVPVNPMVPEILGEPSYPSLTAVPATPPIDIVDVFRRNDQVPAVVDEAIARRAPVVWMQLGVEHPEAAARARAAGITVLENRCIMVEHRRLRVPHVP